MMDLGKLEEVLGRVRKPGRYIGNEWNAVRKNLANTSVKFALSFPDIYEIGMSHLGFKLLYHLLNDIKDVACERVFSPGIDLEEALRKESLPLFTLESKEELLNFDIVGFSLAHELNYTNLLNILDLGRIPLKREARANEHPIVIAGGPSSFNPEPVSDFIDLFLIGEAEDAILEIVECVKQAKKREPDRLTLLKELSQIKGAYAPAFYDSTKLIEKRTIENLDAAYYPTEQIVPNISIVHDRVAIEIMRGCPNLCRFCQARNLYHPKRERSLEKILSLSEESIKKTGYEEISLLSLSSGNHSQIIEIIKSLIERFREKGISISLPSLRLDKIIREFPALLSAIKKSGLTFAPEAGSACLRRIINKNIDLNELQPIVERASSAGYRRIKLYYMIGLPGETYEDIDKIIEAIHNILTKNRSMQINVSINSFIPKPHTPFQWEAMEQEEELKKKINYIKDHVKKRRANLKFHDTRLSVLEGVFSRGGKDLGRVILRAFRKGCRFDSWKEHLKFESWIESFREEGIEPNYYIYKKRGFQENLPWDHIGCGMSKDYLMKEARAGLPTVRQA